MSFSALIAEQFSPVGFGWAMDISTDDFASVAYRWATTSFHDGTNAYDGRLILDSMTPITRQFGVDGFPTASSFELQVDNTDFGADWLCTHSTWASLIPAVRFRLKLVLFYADQSYQAHQTVYTQQVGEYVVLDNPSRTESVVQLSLVDDSLGRIADLAIAPSVNDWIADGDTTTANCPLKSSSPVAVGSWDEPIQLAFGSGLIRCNPVVAGYRGTPGAGANIYPIIICATTDTDASGDTPLGLIGQFKEVLTSSTPEQEGRTIGIPATFVDDDGNTQTIWSQQRTPSISRDGKTWRIIWLQFNATNYTTWVQSYLGEGTDAGMTVVPTVVDNQFYNPTATSNEQAWAPFAWAAFECFWFQGYPLSARTSETFYQSGADVVRDLISYYSDGSSSSDIDTTSFDAVKAALGTLCVGGTISGEAGRSSGSGLAGLERANKSYGMNKLREVLGELLGSIDCDLSLTWLGKYQLTAPNVTFAAVTTTRISIDETRAFVEGERTPSLGERWAPYNRLYVNDKEGRTQGPFDHPTESWHRVFPRTIEGKWVLEHGVEGYWSYVWQRRLVEAKHRSLLRFQTDFYALNLDLGSYFEMGWSRGQGGSSPYPTTTVWRLESISIDPRTLSVGVEAIWQNDLVEEQPYLLDNESLVQISTGGGGRTLSVQNANFSVTASSGSFVADGVEAGDILIAHSLVNGDANFTNDVAVRVLARNSATELEVDYDGWAPDEAALTNWYILKGATTYPTSSDDPTNYPSNGTMYGKTSTASDLFSDSSAANKLKDG